MLFSIVVPVYNVELYIDECMKSLIGQSFKNFEIILVDDGSTDSSGERCDYYASLDKRVKVIHKKNEGLLLARRTGLKECQGEYILHCDSDDYVATDMLLKIKNVIDSDNPDMIMFGYSVVNDTKKVLENHHDVFQNKEKISHKNKEKLIRELSSTTWLNNMVTKATKRECIDFDCNYAGFKDIKMGEDLFQVIPLIARCSNFVYLAESLYFYRYNGGGLSKNIDISYLNNHFSVSERMHRLLIEESVSENTKILFYNRYVKDIFKYFFRFLKMGMTKEQYKEVLNRINDNSLFSESFKFYSVWTKENKFMRFFLFNNYYISKILSKTVLSSKLK